MRKDISAAFLPYIYSQNICTTKPNFCTFAITSNSNSMVETTSNFSICIVVTVQSGR